MILGKIADHQASKRGRAMSDVERIEATLWEALRLRVLDPARPAAEIVEQAAALLEDKS